MIGEDICFPSSCFLGVRLEPSLEGFFVKESILLQANLQCLDSHFIICAILAASVIPRQNLRDSATRLLDHLEAGYQPIATPVSPVTGLARLPLSTADHHCRCLRRHFRTTVQPQYTTRYRAGIGGQEPEKGRRSQVQDLGLRSRLPSWITD